MTAQTYQFDNVTIYLIESNASLGFENDASDDDMEEDGAGKNEEEMIIEIPHGCLNGDEAAATQDSLDCSRKMIRLAQIEAMPPLLWSHYQRRGNGSKWWQPN